MHSTCLLMKIHSITFEQIHVLLRIKAVVQIMFAIWWITAVWFFTWVINYGSVRNWFRETCSLDEATTVHVWAPLEVNILTAHVSPLVWLARKLKVSPAFVHPVEQCKAVLTYQTLTVSLPPAGRASGLDLCC